MVLEETPPPPAGSSLSARATWATHPAVPNGREVSQVNGRRTTPVGPSNRSTLRTISSRSVS